MALLGNPDTETKPTAISTPQLWADFSDRLRAFITQRIANEADAEDILQDVFVRIHQHLQSVQDTERITSWLFQITRNAIVDFYRSPTRHLEQPAGDALEPLIDKLKQYPEAETNEADGQLYAELTACLRPMLDRLPPTYREAVTLAEFEGMTQRETAERLSLSGAKSRVQRGRKALKVMLQECCRVELDAGGRLTDYSVRNGSCSGCGCTSRAAVSL